MKPKEFAKLMGVDEHRVHDWCDRGMPYMPTGDVRGKRIRPSKAMDWLEEHRD
jgi:phage terminase Nu1 subunit (DNA packaging protein)